MKTLLFGAAMVAASTAAFADDNCGDVKNGLSAKYQVVHWGLCQNPFPESADADGAIHCAEVIADGALPHTVGHENVSNWLNTPFGKIPLPNTYLGFCAGVKLATQPNRQSPSVDEIRREIQRALDARPKTR